MIDPQADRRPDGPRLKTTDFERLYRQIGPKLHQFIRRQVPEPAIAADLLQDVFVRLIRAEVRVRSDGEMRSYLYRTAASVIADYYRVAKLRRTVPITPDGSKSEPALHVHDSSGDARQLKAQIDRGFNQLTVGDRTLLWLAYVEEMDHAAIGAAVGVGTASVKVMLFRARVRLAAALQRIGLTPEEAQ